MFLFPVSASYLLALIACALARNATEELSMLLTDTRNDIPVKLVDTRVLTSTWGFESSGLPAVLKFVMRGRLLTCSSTQGAYCCKYDLRKTL